MDKKQDMAENFFEVSLMAFRSPRSGKMFEPVSEGVEKLFWGMHKIIRSSSSPRCKIMVNDGYPIRKSNGEWLVSVSKLYLYLRASHTAINKFKHPAMIGVAQLIKNSKQYLKASDLLFEEVSQSYVDWEVVYQENLKDLWKDYLHEVEEIAAVHTPASNTGVNSNA